jgi:hypothetical protein
VAEQGGINRARHSLTLIEAKKVGEQWKPTTESAGDKHVAEIPQQGQEI